MSRVQRRHAVTKTARGSSPLPALPGNLMRGSWAASSSTAAAPSADGSTAAKPCRTHLNRVQPCFEGIGVILRLRQPGQAVHARQHEVHRLTPRNHCLPQRPIASEQPQMHPQPAIALKNFDVVSHTELQTLSKSPKVANKQQQYTTPCRLQNPCVVVL